MTNKPHPTITVGELLDELRNYPAHYTVDFGGLVFRRFKPRAPSHLQAEFAQTVSLDDEGYVVVDNHD
ncbi:MAG: hypothetical protein BGO62_10545 [Thiobacillus sp. 65-1402]|nr:MAG: hypothetical protein BGO62_10545 [Thiobacillus sp. 65-1402]